MKKTLFFLVLFVFWISANSQDVIVFTNGDEVQAKVTEISDTEVRYKLWNNLEGPAWVKKISEIFLIRYENGSKQTFTTYQQHLEAQQSQKNNTPTTNTIKEEPRVAIFPHTIYWGLRIKEGATILKINPQVDGFLDAIGTRWVPFLTGLIEYYPKQESGMPLGLCVEFQYASRGGNNIKNWTTDGSIKPDIDINYICFRPGFSFRSTSVDWRFGGDFSKCIKATMKYTDDIKEFDLKEMDYVEPFIYGFWMDFDFFVSKKLALGMFFEYFFSDPLSEENFWGEKGLCKTRNWSIGLGITWFANPIKFGTK